MGTKQGRFNEEGIDGLAKDKPVVYKVKNDAGTNIYTVVALRGRVAARLKEHRAGGQDFMPGGMTVERGRDTWVPNVGVNPLGRARLAPLLEIVVDGVDHERVGRAAILDGEQFQHPPGADVEAKGQGLGRAGCTEAGVGGLGRARLVM